MSINPLYYIIPITDMICSFGVAYGTYKYLMWKQNRLLAKMHPDEKNGMNLDLKYQLDGQEVFGIHLRGVDLPDMIDNAVKGFRTFSQKKDDMYGKKEQAQTSAPSNNAYKK